MPSEVLLAGSFFPGDVVHDLIALDRDSPSLVPPHPGPDLVFPVGSLCPTGLAFFGLLQTRSEQAHGCLPVDPLISPAIATDLDAGGPVGQLDASVRFVPVLTSCTGTSGELFFQVLWVEMDLAIRQLRQDSYGHSGCLDTPALFGFGDSLPAVASCLVFERRVRLDTEKQEARSHIKEFMAKGTPSSCTCSRACIAR